MANPSNFQITPCVALVENNEINFRSLYLYHTYLGPKLNQSGIVNANSATGLGATVVNNWTVYDGTDPNATLVARAQGLHINAGNWHNTFSLVFEVERFKGSTLQVMGISIVEGEWAIVGGTGEFTMATGVISKKLHKNTKGEDIIELAIHAFCPLPKGSRSLLTKIGPWGGNGGTAQDITEVPRRLESITVCSGTVVDSIAFSYTDHTGQKRTAGRLGGSGGNPNTIQLASSEFVKEVSGTFATFQGCNVITSLKFVTNVKTYGPFGQGNGTPFTVPVQDNSSVVGFFGRGGTYLDAVGVYVLPF